MISQFIKALYFFLCFFPLYSDLSLYEQTSTSCSYLMGPQISAYTWLCLITATRDVGGTGLFKRDVIRKISNWYTLCALEIAIYDGEMVTESGEDQLHKDKDCPVLFTMVPVVPKTVSSTEQLND